MAPVVVVLIKYDRSFGSRNSSVHFGLLGSQRVYRNLGPARYLITGRQPIKMAETNKRPCMESCIAFAPWTESPQVSHSVGDESSAPACLSGRKV